MKRVLIDDYVIRHRPTITSVDKIICIYIFKYVIVMICLRFEYVCVLCFGKFIRNCFGLAASSKSKVIVTT